MFRYFVLIKGVFWLWLNDPLSTDTFYGPFSVRINTVWLYLTDSYIMHGCRNDYKALWSSVLCYIKRKANYATRDVVFLGYMSPWILFHFALSMEDIRKGFLLFRKWYIQGWGVGFRVGSPSIYKTLLRASPGSHNGQGYKIKWVCPPVYSDMPCTRGQLNL